MCHTLLQYYILCGHVCVNFISCSRADDVALVSARHMRARAVANSQHPNYVSYSPLTTKVTGQVEDVDAEWRDHTIRKGVSHSYFRSCPECFRADVEESMIRRRRTYGPSAWRDWVERNADTTEDEIDFEDADEVVRSQFVFLDEYDHTGSDHEELETTQSGRRGRRQQRSSDHQFWDPTVVGPETTVAGLGAMDFPTLFPLVPDDGHDIPTTFSGRRTPGAERSRRPIPRVHFPEHHVVSHEDGRLRTILEAAELPEIRRRRLSSHGLSPPSPRLGHRVLGRRNRQSEFRDPPYPAVETEDMRRSRIFEAARRHEQWTLEGARAVLSDDRSSEADRARARDNTAALAAAPPIMAQVPSTPSRRMPHSRNFEDAAARLSDATHLRIRGGNVEVGGRFPQTVSHQDDGMEDEDIAPSLSSRYRGHERPILDTNDRWIDIFRAPSPQETSRPLNSETLNGRDHRQRGRPGPDVSHRQYPRPFHPRTYWVDLGNCIGLVPHPLPNQIGLMSSDPTHVDRSSRGESNEMLISSKQHGSFPKPHGNTAEDLSDTWEILVDFEGCGHHNTVYVEKLRCLHDSCFGANCGCFCFDQSLVGAQKAESREICLDCRKNTMTLRLNRLDEKLRPFEWFERYVRVPTSKRTVALWPLDAARETEAERR